MLLQTAFAGGLLTNSNQSAQYVRMLARNAGLEIDAVFYNPAGLIKMEDGLHFAFYNQTIFQTRTINSEFPYLNDGYYEGDTKIPIFPNVYAAYKKDKWAFSLGAGPVAGGGTANFEDGLPSLEIGYAKAALSLTDAGVSGYDLDMTFDASSTYWGIQLGATYAINDKFSVYGGVRLLPSINTYKGSITNVMLEVGGEMQSAPEYLASVAAQAESGATSAYGAATMMDPVVAAGYSEASLADLQTYGVIDAATKTQLEAGLVSLGVSADLVELMTVAQIQGTYTSAGEQLTTTAAALELASEGMEDRAVETKQKGFGVTPIIGFNYAPNDDWTFAAKYEFKTKLILENETVVDDLGLFPDGNKGSYDVPAILSTGIAYRGVDWLEAQLSYNIYFDKSVDFGYNVRYSSNEEYVKREIDNHGHEVTLGFQFNVSDKFAFSIGGLALRTGVADTYQSDFSFSNDANGIGGGIMWKLTDQLVLDAGVSNIWYKDETVSFADTDLGTSYDETYGKKSLSIAVGLSYSIF
jgi:long-subunit fatty acid transport protein